MDDRAREALETAARGYEQSASEFEAAAQHLRVAAQRFREQDVPRGCAHAFAAYGHVRNAQGELDRNAILHASKSTL